MEPARGDTYSPPPATAAAAAARPPKLSFVRRDIRSLHVGGLPFASFRPPATDQPRRANACMRGMR